MNEQRLWAPWRIGYVSGEEDEPQPKSPEDALLAGGSPECFLCRAAVALPEDADHDRRMLVVARTDQDVVVLNRYPYGNGHLLVAPRAHLRGLDELSDAVHLQLMKSITRLTSLLQQVVDAEGFNVGLNLGRIAGAGLPGHLHWHIVPRWNGDHNFMPTLAGTRVIPQSLDALWQALVDST